jgi:large subunit ribosomal protein L2
MVRRRPRTRPVAMNPVDHPMGGGEGFFWWTSTFRNGIPAKVIELVLRKPE